MFDESVIRNSYKSGRYIFVGINSETQFVKDAIKFLDQFDILQLRKSKFIAKTKKKREKVIVEQDKYEHRANYLKRNFLKINPIVSLPVESEYIEGKYLFKGVERKFINEIINKLNNYDLRQIKNSGFKIVDKGKKRLILIENERYKNCISYLEHRYPNPNYNLKRSQSEQMRRLKNSFTPTDMLVQIDTKEDGKFQNDKENVIESKKPREINESILNRASEVSVKFETVEHKSFRTLYGGKLSPIRISRQINITKRNTSIVQLLKNKYQNQCQICGITLSLGIKGEYSEGHHLRPLGGVHKGPDITENLIILCPNHHVMFDNGVITIDIVNGKTLHMNNNDILHGMKLIQKHLIINEYVDYHNKNIYQGTAEVITNVVKYGSKVKLEEFKTGNVIEVQISDYYHREFMSPIAKSLMNKKLGSRFVFNGFEYSIQTIN